MKNQLETRRLILTPLEIADLDVFFQLLRNDHVKKFLCDNRDLERDFVHGILRKSDKLFEMEDLGLWWITKREDEQRIGFCGITKNEAIQPELLYALHPDFLGKGYATEAAASVIRYFREHYPRATIWAKIDEPNTHSQQVVRRLGFKPVGREWNDVLECDMILYNRNEE